MKQSEAQYNASLKYRREKSAQIVLTMRKEDKQAWDEYAAHIGTPTATMIRRAVAASMAADGWTPSTSSEQAPDADTAPEEAAKD